MVRQKLERSLDSLSDYYEIPINAYIEHPELAQIRVYNKPLRHIKEDIEKLIADRKMTKGVVYISGGFVWYEITVND